MLLSRSIGRTVAGPCSCKAATASLSYAAAAGPSGTTSSIAALTSLDNPIWAERSYITRYRDPSNHDRQMVSTRSMAHTSTSRPNTDVPPVPIPMPLDARRPASEGSDAPPKPPRNTMNNGIRTRARRPPPGTPPPPSSPRSHRLEMERLWSGGEASPPLPLERLSMAEDAPPFALLFPGTGSQYVGMGHFLRKYSAAGSVWDEAEDALSTFESWRKGLGLADLPGEAGELGRMLDDSAEERSRAPGLREVVFHGPQDELTKSVNGQPGILVTSIAFLRTLERDFMAPLSRQTSYFLGHSSGEFTAAVASGAISFADGVRLTRLHGLLTTYALGLPSISLSDSASSAPSTAAQMSACIINPGHSHAEVAEVVKGVNEQAGDRRGSEGTVEVASYNSGAQVVLAGTREGILHACETLVDLGIASRAADLPVTAPFHCSFLRPAADGMRGALASVNINSPTAPVVTGLRGEAVTTGADLAADLVAQMALPVQWSTAISNLHDQGVNRLIFLGPGKALANLARRDAQLREKQRTKDQEKEQLDVASVATEEDLLRVREMWE